MIRYGLAFARVSASESRVPGQTSSKSRVLRLAHARAKQISRAAIALISGNHVEASATGCAHSSIASATGSWWN